MNNEETVNQVLRDYYKAFSTLTVKSILRYFYQPALLIGPSGVFALPTPEAVVPIFGPVMESLRQREYLRSEFSLQQLRLLSATSALATGVAIRYKTDGQEMERVGLTYLLYTRRQRLEVCRNGATRYGQSRAEQLVIAAGTAACVW